MLSREPCNMFQPKFICSLVLYKLRARVIFRHWRFLGCLIYKCETRQVSWWCEELFLSHGMEKKNMNIQKICLLFFASSLWLALSAQATSIKTLTYFDATNKAQFLQNDWNPADGDTHWEAVAAGYMNVLDPYLLDFIGANVGGNFVVGDDPWETVSIKSLAGQQLDLRQTQEIQIAVHPQYITSRPYISTVFRLTMQDGSIWDQPKVLANNVWQRAAFPIKEDSFARAEWGPEGRFDLGKVVSWEVILVDLPS